ncbi:MAG: tetratricopeptide repeat protein, partial [Elusimicrobia bacterium]|nr:tetratricopeptide repeat protein [Elusimicrobiota bacterium]
ERSLAWVAGNRRKAALGALALVAALLVAGVSVFQARAAREDAWNHLSLAEGLAYTGRADTALQTIQELSQSHPGSDAANFGTIFAGDILFKRGDYKGAAGRYEKVLTDAPKTAILRPLALCDLALAQESAGQAKQAAQTAQSFLDAYGDHFLAPQAHACLARCLEDLGQTEQAKTTLQKIALQYPDTVWAAWAQARLKKS